MTGKEERIVKVRGREDKGLKMKGRGKGCENETAR